MTIGYVFKCQFFLPSNASQYLNPLNDPFDITTQPITGMNRKKRFLEGPQSTEPPENEISEYHGFDYEQNEKFERHQIESEVIESGTDASNTDEVIDDGLWIEQETPYSDDPRALKIPKNLGTSRFSLYKGIAAVVDRFVLLNRFMQENIFFIL